MVADKERLQYFIDCMKNISEPCEAGVQRQSYTKEYRQGVSFVQAEMEATDLCVYQDGVGNIFGILKGTDESLPMILSGSHLDTVRCAGAYDGIAGVACALEVARMIKESGKPLRHTYGVVGTVGEEGTRFGQVLLGSQFLAGIFGEAHLDRIVGKEDEKSLRQVLKEYGLSDSVSDCCIKEKPIKAFLEVHGEQGPVLETEQIELGIVEHIAGIAWLEITITGQTNHSGTVPMNQRRDAGIGTCKMLLELNDYVTKQYNGKATMTAGQISLQPGSANCIPGLCKFSLDIRSGDKEILDDIVKQVFDCKEMMDSRGLQMDIKELSRKSPVPMSAELQNILEKSCDMLGFSHKKLDSGAGHDAMILAGCFPTAMLFLPNRDGISHNPAEYIAPESMARGAEVLYHTIRELERESKRILKEDYHERGR